MTFHTDAVADLLGVEEANPRGELLQKEDPAGGPINQAEVQPSMPSLPLSYLSSRSAGPSSGHDRTPSRAGMEDSTSQTSFGAFFNVNLFAFTVESLEVLEGKSQRFKVKENEVFEDRNNFE